MSSPTAVRRGLGPRSAGSQGSASGRALIGAFWTAASQLAPYIYTTIISIVAARVLGPEDMGRQSFIAFVVIAAQTVSTSGVGYSLVRHVGELIGEGREGAIRSLVRFGWELAVPTSLIAAASMLMIAVGGAEPRLAWIFGAIAVLAGGLNNVPVRVLIGAQRWRTQSIVLMATGALSVLATIVVLALGGGISGMLAVTAAAALVILVWSARLMSQYLGTIPARPAPLGPIKRDVVRFAVANYIPVILTFVVMQRSEFFFLERFSSDTQIAYYSIAFSSLLALLALPTAVRMIVLPSVAGLVGAGEFDRIQRGFSRLVRLMALVTVPLTAGALALGPALLRLVYGGQYAGAGNVFLILAAPLALVPLSGAASALILGYGRVRVPTLVSAFAAGVDITVAAVLVPSLGAKGAAIANALAVVAATLPALPYCHRLVGGIHVSVSHVARTIFAATVAGVLARLVLELGSGGAIFVAALAVGITEFALIALFVKVIPAEDAEWLAGIARGRGGARVERILLRLAS